MNTNFRCRVPTRSSQRGSRIKNAKNIGCFIAIALALGVALGWVLFSSHGNIVTMIQAKAAATANTPPRTEHILLEVSNMEASIAFYRNMMGLRPKILGQQIQYSFRGQTSISTSPLLPGRGKPLGEKTSASGWGCTLILKLPMCRRLRLG